MDEDAVAEGRAWAQWLQEHLDQRGWRQADLVRESQGTIKRDRASKWLAGRETPSYRSAVYVANTLGIDHDDALIAAGYRQPSEDGAASTPLAATPARTLQDYSDLDLIAEIQRRAAQRPLGDVGRLSDDDIRDALPDLPEGYTKSRLDLAAERGKDQGDQTHEHPEEPAN